MKKAALLVAVSWIVAGLPASAISISIEYVDPMDSFFTATAQSTLQKAASDVSFAITTSLTALSQDVYVGTNGSTTATTDWSMKFINPNDGTSSVSLNTFNFAADEFVIKVGARNIGGSTLGQGGIGGIARSTGASGSSGELIGAVVAMEAASNASMPRGGPLVGTSSGSLNFGATAANFDLDYGYALGALAFDKSKPWHFDYATLPSGSNNDFYSVAVHEILHTLGIGGGEIWTTNISGGVNWDGPTVINYLGSGTDVVDSGGGHIKSGLMGNAIIDGVQTGTMQEAAMTPSIQEGTRKYLTNLDLAFLSDMGWQVVPEPSECMLLALSTLGFALLRRR